MTSPVASSSVESAVTPTVVPTAASSLAWLSAGSLSIGVVGANSLTSSTPMLKVSVAVLVPSEASTTMSWLSAISASSAPATVTTPEVASIANSPPASSARL